MEPDKKVPIAEASLIRQRYTKDSVRTLLEKNIADEKLREQYLAFYDAHPFFQECPAGALHHHTSVGGLETHCREMIGIGLDLLDLYPGDFQNKVTKEDVVIAVFLHDFAKIWSYRYITGDDRASGKRFKDGQEFTYTENEPFAIIDSETKTLLELARFGIIPTDSQASALLFCEGGFAKAHFAFGGPSPTSKTVNKRCALTALMLILDQYSSQLLGKSLV
jgi:hypothetical protein